MTEAGSGENAEAPVPQVLCDVRELGAPALEQTGVLWKLAESGRQLDANVVRLTPGRSVEQHTERDLDVLLLVVSGDGTVQSPGLEPQRLAEAALLWLPRGSTRGITAGGDGLTYLTVHRRRPGLRIGSRPA